MHAYTYRLFFALSLAVAGFAPTAHALDEAQLRDFVLNEVHAGAGRVEVGIDRLAAQLERAPCRRLEPFLSSGARLWGRSTVGVRCADGTRWSTYVPIDVRIYGPALVAARDLNAGETPAPHDVRIEEVELTREPPGLLTDTMQLEHMLVQRTLRAGQPIRTSHLRARPVVTSGALVKLTYSGAGFVVSAEGRALAPAAEGQTVRVQTDSGKVLTGVARAGGIVEIRS
ncbi:MAG TPA: flagellar basal body P-ring formation chaperone FlgA [Burkholderiales bacterium]|nr:flagellar basal body P-ring formation chaperone FlgA [Burkholderiales bacterium]